MLSFDSETYPFSAAVPLPRPVCFTFSEGRDDYIMREFPREILSAANIVTANGVYDFGCLIAQDPEVMPLIIRAYEEDRVEDVLVNQKLQDNACGILRGYDEIDDSEEDATAFEAPKMRTIKIRYDLDTLARRHGCGRKVNKEWQKKFWTLDHLPLDRWPEDAKVYARNDSRITLDSRVRGQHDYMGLCPDYRMQARAAFWLGLMSYWGLKTDGPGVEAFAKITQAERDLVAADLRKVGLLRPDTVLKSGKNKGGIKKGSKNTKLARAMMAEAYEKQNLPVPMTDNEDNPQVSLSKVACLDSGSEVLEAYSRLTSIDKILSTGIPALRMGMVWPIHSHFDSVLATGRTSSSNPNVQNPHREPGIRECFIPREGMCFVAGDYVGGELCTLAESMYFLFGRSTLGEALNSGLDAHLELVPDILKISDGEAKSIYRDENHPRYKWVKNARNMAKVVNFGKPGGLGAKTLVHYARQSYKIKISLDQSDELCNAWETRWPDMQDFFNHVANLTDAGEPVVLPYSGFTRGGGSFCANCNTYFQGPLATIAKIAGWEIMKQCYLGPGPLFGARIVNFVHDEFILECPIANAHDVSEELKRIMLWAAKQLLKHVLIKVETVAMMRWSKEAKHLKDEDGRLIPWT